MRNPPPVLAVRPWDLCPPLLRDHPRLRPHGHHQQLPRPVQLQPRHHVQRQGRPREPPRLLLLQVGQVFVKTKIYKLLFLVRTMIDNECNILSNMSKTEFREFRSLMVEMVLHTGDLPHITLWCHIYCHMLPYIGGDGVGHRWWIDCHPSSKCKLLFSDKSSFQISFQTCQCISPSWSQWRI